MYEIYSDYRNSRKIDFNRWSERTEVDQLVAELATDVESRKKSLYVQNLKVLVLELYQSHQTDSEQYLSYDRGSNCYDFIRERYVSGDRYTDNPHISFDAFVGSVDLLRHGEYIVHSRGGHFYNHDLGEYGFLSRMRATQKLVDLWEKYRITPSMVGMFRTPEVIIQKNIPTPKIINESKENEKTIWVKLPYNYKEKRTTTRMRKVVLAYNTLLSNTDIDCDAACLADEDRKAIIDRLKAYKKRQKPEIRLRLSNKNVYRVFNNRKWDQGGRFFGAWWIGCPSELRKYITLNGEPTVELDYSGIHIHLLYAQKGINYAAKNDDAYNLVCRLPEKDPDRDINKLILLTAINAEKGTACGSVFDQLRREGSLDKYRLKSHDPIKIKLELLKQKHAPIADMIESGEGIKLQYLDSCVMEKLIVYALHYDIPILTVHDSVICPARYADMIKEKMWLYYTDLISKTLNFTIRYGNSNPRFKYDIKRLAERIARPQLPLNYAAYNSVIGNITINRNTVRNWLKPDDLIKIKSDRRSNACKANCNHSKRRKAYGKNHKPYAGTIVLTLTDRDSKPVLSVKD